MHPVTISYNSLVNPNPIYLSSALQEAFGPTGLGVVIISGEWEVVATLYVF